MVAGTSVAPATSENQDAPPVSGIVPAVVSIGSQSEATIAASNSTLNAVASVSAPVAPGFILSQQALADLDATGTEHAAAIRTVVHTHRAERNKAFYIRRITAILGSLGQIFNIPAGLHERQFYYRVPGSNDKRAIKTEFLFMWARSIDEGLHLNLKTARNHQTQWNRATSAIRFLKTRKAILEARILGPEVGDGDELAEVARVLELMEILVDGRDIDTLPPTYSTASEVWKMGVEEWKQLISLYTES